MTDPIATVDTPETGPGRVEPQADALGSTGSGPSPVPGGDGATFAALVERAGGHRPGRRVDDLPTGAAAESWARWRPPVDALGARTEAGPGLATTTAPATTTGIGVGLGPLGSLVSIDSPSAIGHPSGTVFPQARNLGQAVVNAGAEHLGVPYRWGGTDAVKGFDCSGLVQDAYRQIGVELPKWSRHQATMGVEVPSIEAARPGDILTFGQPVNHVALYVGDGRMLHAPRTGEVIKIEEIDRPINSIRRIVDPSGVRVAGVPGQASALTALAQGVGTRTDTPYAELFDAAGRRHDVDPALLAAVARAESGFDPRAVSPVGAQGLMQFMPATAQEMGVDPWDPASAIDGAARYLRTSLDRFGSVEEAVASYNAGPGAVARHGGVPPYPETRNYVRTVLDTWRS